MNIRTDADVMRIANRIDALRDEIWDLINAVQDSEHPNAEAIYDELMNQCWFPASANHVTQDYLVHPERWTAERFDSGLGPYHHTAARKANKTRLNNKYGRKDSSHE